MSSLYLGNISDSNTTYHIHAFTNGLPFREYSTSEISDSSLFYKMLRGRYEVLASGKPIYCTAVNPDIEKQQEYNPHDDRPGTIHIAALDKRNQRMACVISVAVDTGERDHGEPIGLPLENRWRKGMYPEGASLDPFRECYFHSRGDSKQPLKPFQMA